MWLMVLNGPFLAVYGPNGDANRWKLWEELARVYSCWRVLWCIGEDFNIIPFPSERRSIKHSSKDVTFS